MRYLEEAELELKCLAFVDFDFTNPEGRNHCLEHNLITASEAEKTRKANSFTQQGRVIKPGYGFVKRYDRNDDGKVSKNEFYGPDHHFSNFDRNNDGYISC